MRKTILIKITTGGLWHINAQLYSLNTLCFRANRNFVDKMTISDVPYDMQAVICKACWKKWVD